MAQQLPLDRPGRLTPRLLAAALWLAAATIYLGAEGFAARAFVPAYRHAVNYISDLGVPDCGIVIEGRQICSPRHALMNAGFVLHGLAFAAAALVAARAAGGARLSAFTATALTHAIGIAVVAAFPTGATAALDGSLWVHRAGAFAAIVGGNAAALSSAGVAAALGLPSLHRVASRMLGTAGIAALLMLGIDAATPRIDILPDGAWERISVYTIVAWEGLTAACLLAALAARPRH